MVVSLAAYVHASVSNDRHVFDRRVAAVFFVADLLVAGVIVPEAVFGG